MLWPINQPLTNATSAQPPRTNAPPRRADDHGAEKAELQPISGLRPQLLYERYRILENPFGVTPNPRYLYHSKTHGEARASLIIGIECGVGFQALIASPGMGKTTILFHILERFKDVARTALLFQIHGDSHDFLRYLLAELGSDVPDSSVDRLQEAINQVLIREFRSGRRTIVVIDEAQGLNTSILETIRLLSNFETRSEKLLQIVLAGQPQLAQTLENPEMSQLHQRISMLTTLIPFGLEDTINDIEHRLIIAGYQGPPLFTSAALRLIWECSGGVPRAINTLCFNALLLARATEQKQIDPVILQEVLADFDLDRIRLNTGTLPCGIRGVHTSGLSFRNAAEDPPATGIDKTSKAAVSGDKTEAHDASTGTTAFNDVDLVQLGTVVAGIVSTKGEKAVGSGTKTEADDASTRPTAFDEVDRVELGTMATEVVSTSSAEKAEQASVSGAKAKADDASTRPTALDEADPVQLGKIAAEIVSTSSGENTEQAAVSGAGAESDDIVGSVFPPDRPALASHRKTDMVTFAGTGVAGARSRETEATGGSKDALQAMLEAIAAEADWMPETKQDLSSWIESELTSKGHFDLSTGIKPDLKREIEPGSAADVAPTLEVDPSLTAVASPRIAPVEAGTKCETVDISVRTSAQEVCKWLKQQWQAHRVTIYLATSMLVFLLVLADWERSRQSSPEPRPTIFGELLSRLGFAAPPPKPVNHGKTYTRVWVDVHTGLYYCPGAQLYGRTPGGKFTTERRGQLDHFTAATRHLCQ